MDRCQVSRGITRALRGLAGSLIVALLLGDVAVLLPARAQASMLESSTVDEALYVARRRRRKKKKNRRGRKKRGHKKRVKQSSRGVVGVLPFEGDGGGQTMATQVMAGIKSMSPGDGYLLEIALAPGAGRYAAPSVKAALDASKTQAMVRGIGVRGSDQVTVKIFAYSADGKLRFAKSFSTVEGERDPLALAEQIGTDLDRVLPGLAKRAVVKGADAAPPEAGASTSSKIASPPPPEASSTESSASLVGDRGKKSEETGSLAKDASTRSEPLVAVGLGFELLYWSYELNSSALIDTVNWTPLEPYLGGALSLSLWPIEWVGIDAQLLAGVRSYDGDLPVDQASIDLTALSAELTLRGRYLLDAGIGLGAHMAYRFDATFASEQTPVVIAPGYGAHLLSPGLDVYVTAAAPLLWIRLSADVVPWGLYSESPDLPGADAGLWGWRTELVVRSTFALGIYAELRGFYELNYVTYSGQGTRTNFDGVALADAEITNGLRGLSLGLGWSY